ncbi:putative ABC transporter ATP-binding protein [Pseudonocardia sp. N23]|nr:putative ABC transporter ATP-binding protein [Pseudonocardia sp. N23]
MPARTSSGGHDRDSRPDESRPDDSRPDDSRYDADQDDDRYDDYDDEPYERSSIADVREAAKVPIRHIFKRFWPDTKPFRGRMLLSLLLVAVGPALGTVNIYLFKVLVDDIITPQDFRLFPVVAGAFLAITVVGGLINFGDEYMTAWVGEKFVMGLRQRVFDHMHRLSSGYFETRQLGDLLSRLTGDVSSIESLMLSGVNMALTYSFQIVFYAGAMFFLNWQLTLAALVAAPIFLLIARSFSRRIQSAARESRRRAGSISAVAEESFGNVALVQAYDRADHESRRFRDQNLGNFRAQMRAIKIEGLFSPISAFVESVGTLVVIGIGVWELSQNRITLGGLLVFLAYISQLYGPVQGFAGLTNSIFAASASAERIIEVLDAQPGVEDPVKPVRMRRARGAIRITGVGFGYPGTDRTALHDVDLDIIAGSKIAVVGASGAGKSTLTKLLLRTYDPDEGTITLDDVDLRDLTLHDLRRNITAVLQETLVFDGSIADNIRWGRPDATDEDVATAAAAADAHDFIVRLPDGYDTRIGQRGRLLSGGQRQRIAIARAMIRDAPVLLLDEPTTGLDAESTRRVLEPLRRLMDGRTTVIISHNLITVTDADEIVYVEDGTISARGSHDELLVASAGYAHLYRLHHPGAAVPAAPVAAAADTCVDLAKAPAAGPTRRPGAVRRPGPVLRPGPRPRPAVAAQQGGRDRDREDVTSPVPVPFRRREHAEPPAAPRRYVAMPVAGSHGPAEPLPPRRPADEPREQMPARPGAPARPEVYAAAGAGRSGARRSGGPVRDVEETSMLGTPTGSVTRDSGTRDAGTRDSGTRDSGTRDSGTRSSGTRGSGTEWAPAGPGPSPRRGSDPVGRRDDGRPVGPRTRTGSGSGSGLGTGVEPGAEPSDGVDATRVVRPVQSGDTGPRRLVGPRDDRYPATRGRDGRGRDDRYRDDPARNGLSRTGRGARDLRDNDVRDDHDVNGYRRNGSSDEDSMTNGSRVDGAGADRSQVNGSRAEGPYVNGSRADGLRANGSGDHAATGPSTRDGARSDRAGRRDDDADGPRPRRRRPSIDRDGAERRRRDTGSHRPERYDDAPRRGRDVAPDDRRRADELAFGAGAGEVSETAALPRHRPTRRRDDDADGGGRRPRAAHEGRDREPARYADERSGRSSRHPDERDATGRDAAHRDAADLDAADRTRRRRDDRTADRPDGHPSRHADDLFPAPRNAAGRNGADHRSDSRDGEHRRDEPRTDATRADERRTDRRRDRAPRPDDPRRRSGSGRHAVPDVDPPTTALPLVHLTQAFEKLTVPDPRVATDDVDSETTVFRAIPRPRRRSWLTGELPKVPPLPPHRR